MGVEPREARMKSLWPRWIRGPREFAGGMLLMVVAAVALWAARDLGGLHGFSLGPGTVPRLLAVVLFALGAAIALVGLFVEGPRSAGMAWRGPLFVSLAVLAFAAVIRPLGLPLAGFLSFMIAALATPETRWAESVVVGLGLTGMCSLLFSFVLNLPLPLLPRGLMP